MHARVYQNGCQVLTFKQILDALSVCLASRPLTDNFRCRLSLTILDMDFHSRQRDEKLYYFFVAKFASQLERSIIELQQIMTRNSTVFNNNMYEQKYWG